MAGRREPQGEGPSLVRASAQLFVSDVLAACAFYEKVLGFETAFAYGEPPFYAQVARDSVRLNLRHVDAPVWDDARRRRESLLSVYVEVSDVDALYAEFAAAGVELPQPLTSQAWGTRDFLVRDPDGNLLCLAE